MKTIEIRWSTEDVIWQANNMDIELTEEQADAILENVDHYHDASIGINWDVVGVHIGMYMDKLNNK
jgi:hypothetical protein